MKRAKAMGRVIKDRRLLFVFVLVLFLGGIVAGVSAVTGDEGNLGQTAAGDHNWWDDFRSGEAFCERCHGGVGADLDLGQHVAPSLSTCTFCHKSPLDPNDPVKHAAAGAQCTDCHQDDAEQLENGTDAHAGILAANGESTTAASQVCQACHTHVTVNVQADGSGSIDLIMGG